MNLLAKHIVGIDFHDYSAQLVELKMSGGQVFLEAYNRILIPPNIFNNGEIVKEDELKKLLGSLLANANPHPVVSKDIAIIFPSTKLFTHIFSFPDTLSRDEISQALIYEVEKVIPFSIQDVYWDFSVAETNIDGQGEPGKKSILFVAIIKQTADKYVKLLQSMGLNPFLFGMDVETLRYGLQKQIEPQKGGIIIDVGTLSVNYLVVKDNTVKYFFSSNKGGKHLINSLSEDFKVQEVDIVQEKEKGILNKNYLPAINNFIEMNYEVGRAIIAEKETQIGKGASINDIYLTGEFLNLPNFYEIAQKFFPTKNIHIGDPRKSLNINAEQFKTLNEIDPALYYSTYFVNAVGIALQGLIGKGGNVINILPDVLKENVQNKKRTFLLAFSSIFMSAILLFSATFIFFKHQDLFYERKVKEIQKSAIDKVLYGTRYQEILRAINSFNQEVAEISTIENGLFSLPIMFEKINALVMPGITIDSIKFDDSNLSVTITGVATNRESLLATTVNFQTAPFISEVINPISNYDIRNNISFSMELKLIFKELEPYGANTNI